MNRKFSMNGPMLCGQAEQAERIYFKFIGQKSIWYIGIQENPADNIYSTSIVKSGRSDGFGGATMEFILNDGTKDLVQGPWHSNADSLLHDTGIDITPTRLTQGICAKGVTGTMLEGYEYTDVLHYDESAQLGQYDRIMTIAQNLADKLQCRVYYAMKSAGGGNAHSKDPR